MPLDAFASGSLATVLAWLCALPVFLAVIAGGIDMLFEKTDQEVPRLFVAWMTVCILVLSPFRYMVLQLIIGAAYPVQSVSAFISALLLALYVPIVFGLLYAASLALPLLLTLRIAFHDLKSPVVTPGRLVLGSVVAPINMIGGYFLFFWLLSYAGKSVHWLRAEDVIQATNGPAFFAYNYGLKYVTPLPIAGHYQEVTTSDRDMLRNHVASFYLGRRAEAVYVKKAYPALYEQLTK